MTFVFDIRRVDVSEFVETWSRAYRYKHNHLYERNIGQPLTPDSVRELFRWKNGGPLSNRKRESVDLNFVDRLAELSELERDTPFDTLFRRFDGGGPIWTIFWFHCWNPNRFPIYDQHVHRAMEFWTACKTAEIPTGRAAIIKSYIKRYEPFYRSFGQHNPRDLDKALWAFGKYLSNPIFSTVEDLA